jgi:hypothetical protein
LWVVPLTLAVANAFVEVHHRHHGRVLNHRFSLGVVDELARVRSRQPADAPQPASSTHREIWADRTR